MFSRKFATPSGNTNARTSRTVSPDPDFFAMDMRVKFFVLKARLIFY